MKQEISTLNEAIIDLDAPAFIGPGERLQLQKLRSVLATRTGELQLLENQLTRGA